MAQSLEERRKNRKRCNCPPDTRPGDYYEIGTKPLFDDRVQELIVHDSTLRSELPKQQSDRVYGLQATDNLQGFLSRPVEGQRLGAGLETVGDMVRCSPYKPDCNTLLFPFLILEAKSETSSNGFEAIQAQTAFTIWALLKLQEDLQSHVTDTDAECHFHIHWSGSSRVRGMLGEYTIAT